MAVITSQQVTLGGTTPTYTPVNSTDQFVPDEDLFLHVKNTGGSPCTVTLTDKSKTPAGSTATNPTVTVPATSGDKMIGPIPMAMVDTSTGLISVGYAPTTSVTAALLRM